MISRSFSLFFFFNDTATTEIYTLSLHDALPISLQADGYAGFDQVYETGRIQEAPGGRRKFYDLVAQEALRRIGELYVIEAEIRGHLPDERREVRNERARPLLESLQQWLEETLGKLSRKLDTALAVRYARGRWQALLRYLDDGGIEIDNNAAE